MIEKVAMERIQREKVVAGSLFMNEICENHSGAIIGNNYYRMACVKGSTK